MTKYALYRGQKLVKVADTLKGWNFHPYRGNKGFVVLTEEQARQVEDQLRRERDVRGLLRRIK